MTKRLLIMALPVAMVSALPVNALIAQPPQDQLIGDQLGSRDCPGGCDTATAQTSNRSAERHFNRGLKQLQGMDYAKAAKSFGKAARAAPDNAVYSYMTGSSYFLAGEHASALPYLEASVQVADQGAMTDQQRSIARAMLAEISEARRGG